MSLVGWDLRGSSSKLGVSEYTRYAWNVRFCRYSELLLPLVIRPISLGAILMFLVIHHCYLKWLHNFTVVISISYMFSCAILAGPHQSLSAWDGFQVLSAFSALDALLHYPLRLVARVGFVYCLWLKGVIGLSHGEVFAAEVDLLVVATLLGWCYIARGLDELLLNALWKLSLGVGAEGRSMGHVGGHAYQACGSIGLGIWIRHSAIRALGFNVGGLRPPRTHSRLISFMRFAPGSWQLPSTLISRVARLLLGWSYGLLAALTRSFRRLGFRSLHFLIFMSKIIQK
jgi:hypothetical protein